MKKKWDKHQFWLNKYSPNLEVFTRYLIKYKFFEE